MEKFDELGTRRITVFYSGAYGLLFMYASSATSLSTMYGDELWDDISVSSSDQKQRSFWSCYQLVIAESLWTIQSCWKVVSTMRTKVKSYMTLPDSGSTMSPPGFITEFCHCQHPAVRFADRKVSNVTIKRNSNKDNNNNDISKTFSSGRTVMASIVSPYTSFSLNFFLVLPKGWDTYEWIKTRW